MYSNSLTKNVDFNRLKSDFYNYLVQKGDQESASEILSSDISIFSHASDFKNFMQENASNYNLPTGFNGSITDLTKLQYSEENEEFSFENDDSDGASIFSGLLNNLIKDEKVRNNIDSDGNGKLSQEEMTKFLDAMKQFDENQDNLSIDDIFGTFGQVNEAEVPTELGDSTTAADTTPESTSSNSSSGSSTYNPNNYQNTTDNTPKEKTLDNMTKEELKAELSNANNDLSQNQTKLQGLLDGSDSTLKSMEDDADKLFDEYHNQVKLVDEDLANELKTAQENIKSKESEINAKDVEISKKNSDVSAAERDLSSATSNRECLEQSLASLKSTDTSNMTEEKKKEIAQKISELENSKIPEAKSKEQAAKAKLEEEKAALSALQNDKTTLQSELNTLNQQKTDIDTKIAQAHPEILTAQKAYNDAKKNYDDYKTTEVSKAESAVKTSQDRVKEVQTALDKADNKETENKYKASGLASTYNLNGEQYDVVAMNGFDTLEEFQNFILSKGMTNKGKGGNDWPMQCHNFSNEYGDIMLGTSKIDLNSSDAAAQAAKGRDRQFQNVYCETNDAALQVMYAELQAGRPCVVKIRTPDNKNQIHYGLVCGIRQGADVNNLKNTDFLYIDSYQGRIAQLNAKGSRELTGWKNSVHVWQGKDYNFEYKYQNTSAKKYMSAAEVRQAYGLV